MRNQAIPQVQLLLLMADIHLGRHKMRFLTEKEFDKEKIISVLKNNINKFSNENSIILQDVISNFERDDFGLLTPQEIYFLENNDESVWSDYIIFRYKFKIYPKKLKEYYSLSLIFELNVNLQL